MNRTLILTLKLLVGLFVLAVLVFTAGVLKDFPLPQTQPVSGPLLIEDITLVDVRDGVLLPGQDVLIEQGVIEAMGEDLQAPDARIVAGQGRYLVPGLFDMHVHSIKLSPVLTHPLFIAAGVTAVRDMGGCLGEDDAWVACAEEKRAWNSAVQAQQMVGPRFDQVTSLAINGGQEIPGHRDIALGAGDATGARLRVQLDRSRGIDFLKPYTRLPRESYFALAEAAHNEGMYLAGHKPLAVSGLEAVAAGQRSIEHAFLFIWECYPGMSDLRQSDNPRAVYTDELRRKMLAEHDPALCDELHSAMREAGAALTPTHTTRKLDAFATDERYLNDPRTQYIAGPLAWIWRDDAAGMASRAGTGGQESYRAFYRFGIEQTGRAHAAGVQILAGTDAPDSYAFPGSGLHDELEHLVEGGLSPMDALRAATIEPARFLGLEGEAGEIVVGARADLVLLNENPLEDIAAVRSVDAVMLAGALYERSDLDALLAGVEEAAGHWSMWPKFTWQMLTSPIMRRQLID